MRLSKDVRQCVVFLGWDTGDPADPFKPIGTGFRLEYKANIYIVTAQHVAAEFGDDPFSIRLNTSAFAPGELPESEVNRRAKGLHVDPLIDGLRWYTQHPDVDLAVMPFNKDINVGVLNGLAIPEDMICGIDKVRSEIGIGDFCYTVGLFRPVAGKNRNFPIVHTGHIAMMPSGWEKIPIRNWRDPHGPEIEVIAYLVENQSLRGLSGAPVFVRPTTQITLPTSGGDISTHLPKTDFYLLGVWHGAWEGVPDAALSLDRRDTTRVPVGMGIVVPVQQLVGLLEQREMRAQREAYSRETDLAKAPVPD